jgi:hypothetical protein
MKKLMLIITLIFTAVFTSVSAEQVTFDSSDITFFNFYSTNYGYVYEKNFNDFGNELYTITIPSSPSLIYAKGGIPSGILFYDVDGSPIGSSIPFSQILVINGSTITPSPTDELFGTFELDLTIPTYSFPQNRINDIVAFQLTVMTTNVASPGGFIDFLADNTFITTGELPKANFYHEGALYHTEGYNGIVDGPVTDPSTVDGFTFDQWVDSNGIPWNPNAPYFGEQNFYSTGENQVLIRYWSNGVPVDTENAVLNELYQLTKPSDPTLSGNTFLWWEFENGDVVNFNINYVFTETTDIYARFTSSGTGTSTDPQNPQSVQGLTFILETLGWDNTAGYILFISIILIPINLLFAYLKFPVMAIGITNLALLGIFVFLEFLPFWASFVLIGSIIMGLIAMARGVINLE